MQRFETVFEVEAAPERVWSLLHAPPPPDAPSPRVVEYPGGRMEIWFEGDGTGKGMVRTCEFRVPRWLGSGGRARSWEVVTDVRVGEYASYRGVGKPLWSQATGWHKLAPMPNGGTRLTFVETYHVFNPVLRRLFERRVHRFISRDNHELYLKLLGYLGGVTQVSARSTTDASAPVT
ncbi:MAG TPA: SRPBCC family protein [Mycobacteriales bacterium]|nr:SRPBCC family protein [Mycobacteriales bacterium]